MNWLMSNRIKLKNLFPDYRTGRPLKNNRMMFNAILWIARSGAAWLGRFCLRRNTGSLESLFIDLNSEADYENLRGIYSTVVTVTNRVSVQKKGTNECYSVYLRLKKQKSD